MSSEGNEHNAAKATITVDPPSRISNDTPHPAAQAPPPPPDEDQTPSSSRGFSHPGARMICENAVGAEGICYCRKCRMASLTPSVVQCPICLAEQPWLSPAAQE